MQKYRVAWLFLLLQPFPDLFPPFSRLRIKKAIKRDKCRKRWKKPCHKRTQNELHLFLMNTTRKFTVFCQRRGHDVSMRDLEGGVCAVGSRDMPRHDSRRHPTCSSCSPPARRVRRYSSTTFLPRHRIPPP